MYFAGLDLGSAFAKAVVTDSTGNVLSRVILRTGISFGDIADRALDQAASDAGITRADLNSICATGVGRRAARNADIVKPEIVCFARGVWNTVHKACTIVDIGGQDNKVIQINGEGRQLTFKMNRKCAAGTGAFLEEIAHRLDTPTDEMNRRASGVNRTVNIGSFCTVFSVTEIIHHIREGQDINEIFRGVYESVVKRILEMDQLDGNVVLCGGAVVANPVLADLFRERLGTRVEVAPHAQTLGAYGASLYAGVVSDRTTTKAPVNTAPPETP